MLSLFLFGLVLLFIGTTAKGDFPLNAIILFSFLVLTQNVHGALKDDYQRGVLDMMPQHTSFLAFFLISKALILWISIGIPLAFVTMGAGYAVGTLQGSSLFILFPIAVLGIIFIGLTISCLLIGAHRLKGGLLFLAGPFYLPLFLCILKGIENPFTLSSAGVLSAGILLFYIPLCVMGGYKALRMARHYQ